MARKKREIVEPTKPTRIEFETFHDPSAYDIRNLKLEEPTCFNGDVRVRKYRILIELVDEPPEILGARIQEMWDICDNWHHWDSLQAAAKKVGWTLKGKVGNKREDKI